MKVSNLFWHKTPSGRSIPGVIPALVIAAGTIYITFMLVSTNAPASKANEPVSRVEVEDIVDTTTSMETARESQPTPQEESISTRRRGETLSGNLGLVNERSEERIVARNSINTVMTQIMGVSDETPNRRVIDDTPVIPAYVEERALLPTSGTVIDENQEIMDVVMVGFSREESDPEPVQTRRISGFENQNFLPRGYRIPVVLLGRFETGGMDNLVEFAVVENVVFQNKVILDKGVRILATGSQGAVRSRVTFSPETILYPDGRELSISGLVKSLDGHTGLNGEYVQPPIGVDIAGYSGPLLEALAVMATETESRTEVISSDSATVTQSRDVAEEFSARNALIGAAQEIGQRRIEDRLVDYIERNAPYVKVDPGTRGYVILSSAVDFETAMIGGTVREQETDPAVTERMVREAVNEFYTYGTLGGFPESPQMQQPREREQPRGRESRRNEIVVPGLR